MLTRTASWPQAASISRPRVLRTVTVTPSAARLAAKAATRSGDEPRTR